MAGASEVHDEARTVATEGERAIRNGETDAFCMLFYKYASFFIT